MHRALQCSIAIVFERCTLEISRVTTDPDLDGATGMGQSSLATLFEVLDRRMFEGGFFETQ